MPTLLCLTEASDQIVRKGSEEERRGGEEQLFPDRRRAGGGRWQALGAGTGRPKHPWLKDPSELSTLSISHKSAKLVLSRLLFSNCRN